MNAEPRRGGNPEGGGSKRMRQASRVGRSFIKLVRLVHRELGMYILKPINTKGVVNWDVTILPHKDGKSVSIRMSEEKEPVTISVQNLLSGIAVVANPFIISKYIFLPDLYADDEELVLLASITCRSRVVSKQYHSRHYRSAMYHASSRLRKDREFVARAIGGRTARSQELLWSHTALKVRNDRRFSLELVLKHGCDLKAIATGASPGVRQFILRYVGMVPLALCAQSVMRRADVTQGRTSSFYQAIWTTGRNIREFVG